FVMQGSNADIIKVAMIRIHRRLREEGRAARLVLQVHDELLLDVPDKEATAVKELVRAEMCGAFALDPPLAVDVGVGENWAEAKSEPTRNGVPGAAPGGGPHGFRRQGRPGPRSR